MYVWDNIEKRSIFLYVWLSSRKCIEIYLTLLSHSVEEIIYSKAWLTDTLLIALNLLLTSIFIFILVGAYVFNCYVQINNMCHMLPILWKPGTINKKKNGMSKRTAAEGRYIRYVRLIKQRLIASLALTYVNCVYAPWLKMPAKCRLSVAAFTLASLWLLLLLSCSCTGNSLYSPST